MKFIASIIFLLIFQVSLFAKEIKIKNKEADFFFLGIKDEIYLVSTGPAGNSFRNDFLVVFIKFKNKWFRLRGGNIFEGFFVEKNFTVWCSVSESVLYDPVSQDENTDFNVKDFFSELTNDREHQSKTIDIFLPGVLNPDLDDLTEIYNLPLVIVPKAFIKK